ncbi:DUF2563 family protein [[Mycobacterium] vasticus]|uniref:DUF2563 family protein n=1 Tax=[Mycobacterium] vasticus TaxID=2875777 RepID=A0ABU5Z136_9MYCO|nr:DUF2563 family protein [Mycolicibacter sp. MYC017]MEB3071108.1 DUF2563 family protein [Mycolicibacter sp. MYC017]
MHVVPHALRTGANVSDDAGGHANNGAQRLGLAGVTAGMFGDFDDAHSFHTALGSAKDDHRDALAGHHENLTGIATNVRTAATTFTNMDDHNAKLLGAGLRRPVPLSPRRPPPVPLNPYVTVPTNPYPPGGPRHLAVADLNTQLVTYGTDLASYSNKPAPLNQAEYLERYAEFVQLQGDLAGIVAGYKQYNMPVTFLPPAPPPGQPTSAPHR